MLYIELEQHICASRFSLIRVKTDYKNQLSPPGEVLTSLNSLRKPRWLVDWLTGWLVGWLVGVPCNA